MKKLSFLVLFLALMAQLVYAQEIKVTDSVTKDGIPFATVRFEQTFQGIIADLNGFFNLPAADGYKFIEVSATGYTSKKVTLPIKGGFIRLAPAASTLTEVTVRPPLEKTKRIVNKAIAARDENNPDGYSAYQCHTYFKMAVDKLLPDSVLHNAEAAKRKNSAFFTDQHLLLSETYSIRTWRKPQQLQEDVLATRISGWKNSVFTSLVTDVLPFHSYNNYIKLNEKDYHNPISRGYEQNYRLNLVDELQDGTDTIWALSFSPKRNSGNLLSGTVYIHSDGYAISQIIAQATDSGLKQTLRIEQQYRRVPYSTGNRWFPSQLNYIIYMGMSSDTGPYTVRLKGNSQIDSVSWTIPPDFSFDKQHTIRITPGADAPGDTLLSPLRPTSLTAKETRTYKVIDSIGEKIKVDRVTSVLRHATEGKLSLGIFDVDVARVLLFNKYENVRLGMGLQTNEKIIKWLSVGGWGGYGFRDKQWKYGLFTEIYANRYRDFVFRAEYSDDISDPGRVKLYRSLDKGYLRALLLQRADHVKTYQFSIRKKIAYWHAEVSAQQQDIQPLYAYALRINGTDYSQFKTQEASLNLRYAYAERTAPFFGSYYSMGSRYPVLYGKFTAGLLSTGSVQQQYMQAISALTWQKHINRLGNEQFLLQAAKTWSDNAMPLSKLFAGNGFRYNDKLGLSLYAFGGLMSIYPYEYYTDAYVQLIYRHDFDWKLYKLAKASSPLSSAPNIAIQYGLLYGTMAHQHAHLNIPFSAPGKGYQEAGIMLNNLLRMRANNTYYYCLNIGYFSGIYPAFDPSKNGSFVLGASAEF